MESCTSRPNARRGRTRKMHENITHNKQIRKRKDARAVKYGGDPTRPTYHHHTRTSTEVRTCTTQSENKRRKQQRARAPLRQPSATVPTWRDTPKGNKTKSPFFVVLKTYHLTGIHHKTCLKHSNFPNRKLCVQLLPTRNTMATARGQGTEAKTKYAKTS